MSNSWAVIESSENDLPLIIRIRQKVDTALRPPRPHKITIIWSVIHGRENGFPVKMEQLEMESFEDYLVKAVENDDQAVLLLVYTHAGTREWVFHARNVNEFSKRLNGIPHQNQKYPIEIYCDEDPSWTLYDQEYETLLGDAPDE